MAKNTQNSQIFLILFKLPSARIEAIAKNQYPSVRNLTNKPGYSHTTKYYAAIKMNGIACGLLVRKV